ncbi:MULTISPECIES: RadC family protein [unclassified Dermacoccus]|uniref:JAB domain-containing protein n=1 Tax=unclassified Dermacoccus TaxID=2643059 RepID=UPI00104AF71C|nr:DNA repair protein RadC [Dermacoccus sp. SAI-028]
MSDGPRERLMIHGASALSDAELVALHLGTGSQGAPVLVLAHRLLDAWGGVAGLARAEVPELARTPGVGPAKASRLVAAFALGSRGGQRPTRPLRSSADIAALARAHIGHERVEHVLALVLDARLVPLHTSVVSRGGAAGASLPVRELLALTMRHDGVALAVAHNHPSGHAAPSRADLDATHRLRTGCDVVGVRLLDHVVVTDGDAWASITSTH